MTKNILSAILLMVTASTSAQKIALLDTKLKKPVLFTDSLTMNQIYSGYFPVKTSEIDSFYFALSYLRELANKRQRVKMQYFEFKFGGITFKTDRIPMGYGDRYKIQILSTVFENTASYQLSDGKNSNIEIVEKIDRIIRYLKKDQSVTLSPYTKAPKFYNVIVVSDR